MVRIPENITATATVFKYFLIGSPVVAFWVVACYRPESLVPRCHSLAIHALTMRATTLIYPLSRFLNTTWLFPTYTRWTAWLIC